MRNFSSEATRSRVALVEGEPKPFGWDGKLEPSSFCNGIPRLPKIDESNYYWKTTKPRRWKTAFSIFFPTRNSLTYLSIYLLFIVCAWWHAGRHGTGVGAESPTS